MKICVIQWYENNFIMKMKEFIINYIFLLIPVRNNLNGNI